MEVASSAWSGVTKLIFASERQISWKSLGAWAYVVIVLINVVGYVSKVYECGLITVSIIYHNIFKLQVIMGLSAFVEDFKCLD